MSKRKFTFLRSACAYPLPDRHSKFNSLNFAIILPVFVLLASCLFLALPASLSAVGELKVGVLELRNEAGITDQEAKYLTDRVRDVASRSLARHGFLVMTRENIREMLPPGMDLAKCTTASCEVEVGRKVGADYIVTGEILRYAGDFRANIKAHHSESGQFLGAEVARADNLKDLESSVSEASGRLFALIRRHTGRGTATQPGASEGSIGEAGPGTWDFNAAQKTVVRFECDPKDAVVTVDGKLLCRSTPCSKTLPVGTVAVSMDAERYKRKEKTINIAKGMKTISFKLDPNFGWLSVESEPSGLAVTIDGKDMGHTPIQNKEFDPGSYEVLVTDPRYYDKGERVNISVGKSRTVSVTLPPREGGIEISATDKNGNALNGEVFVDGAKVGDAPGAYKLMVGSYAIEVKTKQGTWKGNFDVKEREVMEIIAQIKPNVFSNTIANKLKRVAILELVNSAGIDASEAAYLSYVVRTKAISSLPGSRFIVFTKESIKSLLPENVNLAECSSTSNQVEIGRIIAADYVVTGEIRTFANQYRVTLKVHHCYSAAILGAKTAKATSLSEAEEIVGETAEQIMELIRDHTDASSNSMPQPDIPSDSFGVKVTPIPDVPPSFRLVAHFVPYYSILPGTPCSREKRNLGDGLWEKDIVMIKVTNETGVNIYAKVNGKKYTGIDKLAIPVSSIPGMPDKVHIQCLAKKGHSRSLVDKTFLYNAKCN